MNRAPDSTMLSAAHNTVGARSLIKNTDVDLTRQLMGRRGMCRKQDR